MAGSTTKEQFQELKDALDELIKVICEELGIIKLVGFLIQRR